MSILTCGRCGHPGVHAEVVPEGSDPDRCPTQCRRCREEMAEEQENDRHGDSGAPPPA